MFSAKDKLVISIWDLDTDEIKRVGIYDEDHIVHKFPADNINEAINSNMNIVPEYLNNNSIITGLFFMNELLVVKTESGYFEFKENNNGTDDFRRKTNFYFLDMKTFIADKIQLDHDFNYNNNWMSFYNDTLYCLKNIVYEKNIGSVTEEYLPQYELQKLTYKRM